MRRLYLSTSICFSLCSLGAIFGQGSNTGPDGGQAQTRNLWNEAFLRQRSIAAKAKFDAAAVHGRIPPTPPPGSPDSGLGNGFVGVTLWHLREALEIDPVQIRGLVHGRLHHWLATRTALDSSIYADEYVRLSIESARKGYLYVVGEDVYADGTTASPMLVFPTKRLLRGDNRIWPGAPIEIPALDDDPPVFEMVKTRKDQVAFLLTILVTPRPIPSLEITESPLILTNATTQDWKRRWGSTVHEIDDAAQVGKLYSLSEQRAARDKTKPLLESDPIPMALFHSESKPDNPILVQIPLQVH